jgi:hypothetical protein
MQKLLKLVSGISFLILLFAFSQTTSLHESIELKGTVLSAETGRPVANAYVYTVEGEEEGLTNKNGHFKFTTWKKLPVSVTVVHKDYLKQVIRVTSAAVDQEIRLKKR